MSEATVKFILDDDGYPHQLHYDEQEAQMTDDQRWTFDRFRETYLACQRALRMEQGIKRHAAKRLDAEAARKHIQWQQDADETARLLRRVM